LPVPLGISEEEQLVLDDPAAARAAELILAVSRRGQSHEGIGAEGGKSRRVELQILEDVAVELIGSALGGVLAMPPPT
jgi:hypothetical protein